LRAALKRRKRRRRILALGVFAVLLAILSASIYVLTLPAPNSPIKFEVRTATAADSAGAGVDPCSGLALIPENVTAYNSPPIANYDEQIWAIMSQSTNSIAYNVTAVEQSDGSGYGPAYLISGYSNTGYWYQTGIAWHWVVPSDAGYYNAFDFFVQVYHGNSQLANSLSELTIHGGDNVTLQISLSKSSNEVVMSAYDPSTGAKNQTSWSAYGASDFVGDLHNTGTPTGLLVETYGRNLVCGLRSVTFFSRTTHPGFGLRIDEWNFTGVSAQDRFQSGNPDWSYPENGVAPNLIKNGCLTYLGTTACVSSG
jgi:hypothetical protein